MRSARKEDHELRVNIEENTLKRKCIRWRGYDKGVRQMDAFDTI